MSINTNLPFAQALNFVAQRPRVSDQTDIGAFENALGQQPGNLWIMRPFTYELEYAGYHYEAIQLSERYVSQDPLSPTAN